MGCATGKIEIMDSQVEDSSFSPEIMRNYKAFYAAEILFESKQR